MTERAFRQAAFIDGAWVQADADTRIDVTDPGTGQSIGWVPDCGAAETERAIQAAARAQPEWAGWSAQKRCTKVDVSGCTVGVGAPSTVPETSDGPF